MGERCIRELLSALSRQDQAMQVFAAKFEELRRHTNLSAEFMTP